MYLFCLSLSHCGYFCKRHNGISYLFGTDSVLFSSYLDPIFALLAELWVPPPGRIVWDSLDSYL